MSAPLVGVVTNPRARRNRGDPGHTARLQRAVGDAGVVRCTTTTAEVAEVAREFMDAGIRWWVADGGDGAFHWLVNAAWDLAQARHVPLPAILPANGGTMNFLGRRCGVRGRTLDLVATLAGTLRAGREPGVVAVTSMQARATPADGSPPLQRIGFVSAVAGVGQAYFPRYYACRREGGLAVVEVVVRLVGAMAALNLPGLRDLPALEAARRYGRDVFPPLALDVAIDGKRLPFEQFRTVNVGTVAINLAGLVRMFPYARQDGVLEVQAGLPTLLEALANVPRLFAGAPLHARQMVDRPAAHLAVAAREGTLAPVIDGEVYPGLRAIEFRLGPRVQVVRVVA